MAVGQRYSMPGASVDADHQNTLCCTPRISRISFPVWQASRSLSCSACGGQLFRCAGQLFHLSSIISSFQYYRRRIDAENMGLPRAGRVSLLRKRNSVSQRVNDRLSSISSRLNARRTRSVSVTLSHKEVRTLKTRACNVDLLTAPVYCEGAAFTSLP